MMPSQFLKKGPVFLPGDGDDCPDVPLHPVPFGVVLPGNIWIQPFGHQKQGIRLVVDQIDRISNMVESRIVGGDPKTVQQEVNPVKIENVLRRPPFAQTAVSASGAG